MKLFGRIDPDSFVKKVKVDKRDRKIMTLLSENGRMSLTQIAKNVYLSRDAVNYRIKRLGKIGVILHFFPDVNYATLGFHKFHIFLLLDEQRAEEHEKLIAYLKYHPNVMNIIEYSDRWDLEIVLLARDLLEFDKIMLEITEKFSATILEKDKVETIKRFISFSIPPLLKTENPSLQIIPERKVDHKIDAKDLRILSYLTENGRASTYEIGSKAGLSADAVGYRLKDMEKSGVIKRHTLAINFSLLDYQWYTFIVGMKVFNSQMEKKFEEFVRENPSIIRAAKTLGGWDLLLYIVVEDQRQFHMLVKKIKKTFYTVIRTYETWVTYKEHVFQPFPKALCEVKQSI